MELYRYHFTRGGEEWRKRCALTIQSLYWCARKSRCIENYLKIMSWPKCEWTQSCHLTVEVITKIPNKAMLGWWFLLILLLIEVGTGGKWAPFKSSIVKPSHIKTMDLIPNMAIFSLDLKWLPFGDVEPELKVSETRLTLVIIIGNLTPRTPYWSYMDLVLGMWHYLPQFLAESRYLWNLKAELLKDLRVQVSNDIWKCENHRISLFGVCHRENV